MLLRLVYEKAKNAKVERIEVPIYSQSEISLKANLLSAIFEEPGVTHNFSCIKFMGKEEGWQEYFIPNIELERMF